MDVVVVGGHGRVALRLLGLLAERGDRARGLIRNPEHAADLEAAGAEPVIADLEQLEPSEIARQIAGAHAVVFAAGAGPGSGPERKRTVDLGAAVKLIEAARAADGPRYVMVSAIGVTRPDRWADEMRPYYEAKAAADQELERSGLEYTIVRPGGLTDDPGTGLVEAAPALERSGRIPRDDVAAVLLAVLDSQNTTGVAFDVISGETPIAEAVSAL
jgi:uncharacterized protein YbjT (DUF2867 family)